MSRSPEYAEARPKQVAATAWISVSGTPLQPWTARCNLGSKTLQK